MHLILPPMEQGEVVLELRPDHAGGAVRPRHLAPRSAVHGTLLLRLRLVHVAQLLAEVKLRRVSLVHVLQLNQRRVVRLVHASTAGWEKKRGGGGECPRFCAKGNRERTTSAAGERRETPSSIPPARRPPTTYDGWSKERRNAAPAFGTRPRVFRREGDARTTRERLSTRHRSRVSNLASVVPVAAEARVSREKPAGFFVARDVRGERRAGEVQRWGPSTYRL